MQPIEQFQYWQLKKNDSLGLYVIIFPLGWCASADYFGRELVTFCSLEHFLDNALTGLLEPMFMEINEFREKYQYVKDGPRSTVRQRS